MKLKDLKQENAKLREALRPFAEWADRLIGLNNIPDECPLTTDPEHLVQDAVRVKDLRHARRVLGDMA